MPHLIYYDLKYLSFSSFFKISRKFLQEGYKCLRDLKIFFIPQDLIGIESDVQGWIQKNSLGKGNNTKEKW